MGIWSGRELPLRLALTDLLPANRESVLDMRAVEKEFGGIGYLITLVGPMDKPEAQVEKVARTLRSLPDIRYAFYEREEYLLRDQVLFLLPDQELKTLTRHVGTLFDAPSGGIDLGLDDEEIARERQQEAKAYFEKFKSRTALSRYYLSKDGRYALVLAKPRFDSEDIGQSKVLIQAAEAKFRESMPEVPVELLGRYAEKVRDTEQINLDIERTGLISALGIALLLIWGLGSLRSAIVTMSGVMISIGWTLGIAKYTVGQINILTGFLLAILGGLGVEYGVHLIRRYHQERAMGHSHDQAVNLAYHQIGRALFSAAVTSAGAFLILSISDFRGFSELGIIAGFGILSIYIVYMLCFPFAAGLLRTRPRFGESIEIFGYYPFSSRASWIVVPTLILALVGVYRAEFEYDFERMHDLSKRTKELNKLTNEMFGRSFVPSALLANSPEQAQELEDWLRAPDRSEIIEEALSLYSLVPTDLSGRMQRILKLRQEMAKVSKRELEEKTGLSYERVKRWLSAAPLERSDLPPQIIENFGKNGNVVLVYPRENIDRAEPLRRFARLLAEARVEFAGLKIGSDARIFVEILDHIVNDGRIVLLLFLVGAFFVFWLDFRNPWDALALEAQLVLGIGLLVASMGLVGERFSILNVAMVPAVLAAGIDMGVHVRHRENEGYRALASARFVAQAVQLSVLTTIIGFGSLFFAEASMLKGIAWISVLGQLSMYFICMVLFPISKDYYWRMVRGQGEKSRHEPVEASLGE